VADEKSRQRFRSLVSPREAEQDGFRSKALKNRHFAKRRDTLIGFMQ
jgi:hypothetical protein